MPDVVPIVSGLAGTAVAGTVAYRWLDSRYKLGHDLNSLKKLIKVQLEANTHIKNNHTIADMWEINYRRHPDKAAFLFEDRTYTFRKVEEGANTVAHWAQSQGVGKGTVVALFMDNRPEFFMTWLGICKAGAITALLNYNTKGDPLLHSLKISGAKHLLVGSQVQENVAEIADRVRSELGMAIFSLGGAVSFGTHLDPILSSLPLTPLPRSVRAGLNMFSKALLVYTSGTTGMPKAATIQNIRFFFMGYGFHRIYEVRNDDVVYTVLPLYHSAGGLVGMGLMMFAGCTVALRNKFSINAFWDDCRKHNVTVIQYIGELCRYLVGAPKTPRDAEHKVRLAIGNGLRPEVWGEFQDRFGIAAVGEFYGSTEGNVVLFNLATTKRDRGAVGRSGAFFDLLGGFKLVKFDVATEQPVRGKDGFCIPVEVGEAGELLGPIKPNDLRTKFDGYHGNEAATRSKIIQHVLKNGDMYFRTGDLLRRDAEGYWYFVDRIGDTFRWKGENVSTTEVAEVVSGAEGVSEANVYGVHVPGNEGRACAVALVLAEGKTAENMDWAKFAATVSKSLPSYAMPLFLRLLPKIQTTGTFKHQKADLVKQGIDPTLVEGDKLLRYDPQQHTYVPFGLDDWKQLALSKARL